MARGPVLISLEEDGKVGAGKAGGGKAGAGKAGPSVADAPPVPDPAPAAEPRGAAMQAVMQRAARPPSRLVRWLWAGLLTLLGAVLGTAAWDFVTGWITRQPVLGWALAGLVSFVLAALLAVCARELAALRRLARVDGIRRAAEAARASGDLGAARAVTDRLVTLYAARAETDWGRQRLAELAPDQMDAAALLALADAEVLAPLDRLAEAEVARAARQVATVTALVPLALADVVAALTANLRMIRAIAEIYGGRGGVLGGWRLTRAVMAHLVATGAVAVGDDLLEPVLGGSLLGKLSRRFGEGLVNGALTARVGVAAMEVCRPLPFEGDARPRPRRLVSQALGGLFGSGGA